MWAGLYIGSFIFIVLGVLACGFLGSYVSSQSRNPQHKMENRQIACISITISTFCMWLMWICTYMHQMYPLIVPVLEHGGH